ncbi:MAG: gliding motility lipoprotein GldD [Bacteroidetes bacterium]|nr:gliding motility lipoprotein GldD [Bacteroidota bacterium]
MNYKFILSLLFLITLVISCDEEDPVYSPKPRGYCRIDFPKKEYVLFDTTCPYQFEIPKYSRIAADDRKDAQPCWYNIEFPKFKATIHLSYKPVTNNISNFIDTSHYFAMKHQIKATGLEETPVIRDSSKVYGLLFDIGGNTASSLQFYLTDSTHHFLRGSLYFNVVPNIDSLKIVVDFIRQDVIHLINTTRWKKN